MDWIHEIMTFGVPALTALVGWFAGAKKRRVSDIKEESDALKHMQDSIDMLSARNSQLMEKMQALQEEVAKLRAENAELRTLISSLKKKEK